MFSVTMMITLLTFGVSTITLGGLAYKKSSALPDCIGAKWKMFFMLNQTFSPEPNADNLPAQRANGTKLVEWLNGSFKQVDFHDFKIPVMLTHTAQIPARVYVPRNYKIQESDQGWKIVSKSGHAASLPVVLGLHGGGNCIGNIKMYHAHYNEICKLAKDICVVSIEYRLAPEYPFPTNIYDCEEALKYLSDNAEQLGIDRKRIAVLGNSAGGRLTFETGDKSNVLCKVLINAPLGGEEGTKARENYIKGGGLVSMKQIEFFRKWYDRKKGEGKDHCVKPPLKRSDAELKKQPDMLLTTCEHCPCQDGVKKFRDRVTKKLGMNVEHRHFMTFHGALAFRTAPKFEESLKVIVNYLRKKLVTPIKVNPPLREIDIQVMSEQSEAGSR